MPCKYCQHDHPETHCNSEAAKKARGGPAKGTQGTGWGSTSAKSRAKGQAKSAAKKRKAGV